MLASGHRTPCCVIVAVVEGPRRYRPSSALADVLWAPGSVLLYDVVGTALLEAPFSAATLAYMEKLGAPWVFSSDTPAAMVEGRGWTATVTDMAVPGH